MILYVFGDAKGGAKFEARTVQDYLEMASDPAKRHGELMHQMVIGESRRGTLHNAVAMAPEIKRYQFFTEPNLQYRPTQDSVGKVSKTRLYGSRASWLTHFYPRSVAPLRPHLSSRGGSSASPSRRPGNSRRR